MAVSSAPTPLPKGEPDISKLNTFAGHTVQVTKYLQPRGGMGTTVLPPTAMPLSQILQLMTSLPLQHNAGFYKFSVSDTGGTGDDVWMTRLGPEVQEVSMSVNGVTSSPTAPGAPLSEGVRHLGHGFYYDATLGLLTTPWREIVPWSEGQGLPKAPASAGSAAATPWMPPPGTPGAWGGYPVESSDSAEVKRLQLQIAEDRRRTEMDAVRADVRNGQAETAKMFSALVDKLTAVFTAKPTGPDPEVQRRLDESERRAERAEQRAEEERREAARRLETQALTEKFERGLREATANKTDPMLPMLLQLMTAGQAAASESVKAIQAAAAQTAAASERGVTQLVASMAGNQIGPLQLVTLLQSAKSDSADAAKTMMETSKDLLVMQKETLLGLVDATGQGNQPAWLPPVMAGIEKVSQLGVALAERNALAQQAQQQAQQAPPRTWSAPPQQRAITQPSVGPMQGASAGPTIATPEPLANRPGAVSTGLRPEGTEYDTATDSFIVPDGRVFNQADVAKNGWKSVLARNVRAAPVLTVVPDAPAAPTASVAPTTTTVAATAKSKRRGKPRVDPAVTPPANKTHYSPDEMRDMDPAALFTSMTVIPDADLFGPLLMPYIQQLRSPLLVPDGVAKAVLSARGQIQGAGVPIPMAMELLEVGQLQVLVARLFPEAEPVYRDEVVAAIGNALEAEDTLDEEEDEDEETAPAN